jgi:hypothetical protein
MDVHNPIYLDGLHNYTAHHNRSGAKFGQDHNYNGVNEYGTIDLVCMIIDRASGSCSNAIYLDEVALHLCYQAEQKECDAAYVHYILQNFSTGESLLELWHLDSIKNGYSKMPKGLNGLYFNDDKEFVYALRNNTAGKKLYPRLFSEWSPASTDEARMRLANEIETFSSFHHYITARISNLSKLDDSRIARDFHTLQSTAKRS